ncbi:amino acid permease [Luteipulveratus mongoliensis]|uniref:Amino acid permease n=1 Tax=Luteipulveratus mongoliensis TaxID=571913 RepID=A0A0K1JLZ0_9MICO|nr:amino acid permease [Luteipulveratus mongoliensis]AKU17724.1 amino acid permease [Luteipulveratus mongoliensis]
MTTRDLEAPAVARTGLSVVQGSALTVGAVLGTGVISLPAVAAGIAGPASLVAWAALIALSIPLATTFASLGARYPDSGGVSTYARLAFGPRAATVVGWTFYLAVPMGAPPAASFAGGYISDMVGGGRSTQILTIVVLTLIVGGMNAFGIRVSGSVQLVLTGVLALLLLAAIVAALPHAEIGNLTPFAPHGWAAVGSAAAVLVWAFAGWEAVSSLSSEYDRPRRDIPRATAVAIGLVGVLYVGVAGASILVLGGRAGSSTAPLSDLLATGFGEPARVVTTAAAILLTIGVMNAYFAGGARLGAALGRDGALPGWLARGSQAGEVPLRSLGVLVALCLLSCVVTFVVRVDLTATLLLVTGSFTFVYLVGSAAAIKLLPRGTWGHRGAVISFASAIGLLWMTGWHVLWTVGVATAALVYAEVRDRRTSSATLENPSATASSCTVP